MLSRNECIAIGVIVAVVAFGYLATKREINATIEAGIATVTYQTSVGAGAAPTATEDSHARMLRLIEQSSTAIAEHDADPENAQP